MQIASTILSDYKPSAEEKIIGEMERARAELTGMEADSLHNNERFKNAKTRFGALREELATLRSKNTEASKQHTNRRQPLTSYLEKRLFESEFPDDAQRLKTYQIYTSKARKENLSFTSLEYLGTNVDVLA